MGKQDLKTYGFKLHFRQISCIAQLRWFVLNRWTCVIFALYAISCYICCTNTQGRNYHISTSTHLCSKSYSLILFKNWLIEAWGLNQYKDAILPVIDLVRNGHSGCANGILGCAKCHFLWKSPWKWKNQGVQLAQLPVQNTGALVAG